MTEVAPCLVRVGENVRKYKIFKLEGDQVTIGRSEDVSYCILSSMISRCHALFKCLKDGTWTVTDNKSLNGTFVNEEQLTPLTQYSLHDGDVIQFGVSVQSDHPAEFIYRFHAGLRMRIEKKAAKRMRMTETAADPDKQTLSQSDSSLEQSDGGPAQKVACHRVKGDFSSSKVASSQAEQFQKQKEAEYLSRLAEMERLLKEKEEYQQQVQRELEQERREKENQAKELEELKLKEHAILQEMQEKQKELEREKTELQWKMQEELEKYVKERETALLAQLTAQKDLLLAEKRLVEESLQAEMTKVLEEKDKQLEEQLLGQKETLEKILIKKDMEQQLLVSQLKETKEENDATKMEALKVKEEVLSKFVDLMETELQCSVCNELFIKATSLNCSHVFCKLCINQWMKVKKECPNCRTAITSQMQAIALDSYIDRMVEQLNEDMKQRRLEILERRKGEQAKFDGAVAGPSTVTHVGTNPVDTRRATPGTRGGRGRVRGGRGRVRGGRYRGRPRNRITTPEPPMPAAVPQPPGISAAYDIIELSDDSFIDDLDLGLTDDSMSSDSNTDIGSPDLEEDTAYYGGYGRCYRCGMRGHWSNGCPN